MTFIKQLGNVSRGPFSFQKTKQTLSALKYFRFYVPAAGQRSVRYESGCTGLDVQLFAGNASRPSRNPPGKDSNRKERGQIMLGHALFNIY